MPMFMKPVAALFHDKPFTKFKKVGVSLLKSTIKKWLYE